MKMCDSVCVGTMRLWHEEDMLNPLLALSLLLQHFLSSSSHSHVSVCDKQTVWGLWAAKSLNDKRRFPAAIREWTDTSGLCSVTVR